jgi:hypothetical protein
VKWHRPEDLLPKCGKYVLIHIPSQPWGDSSDQEGVFYKIAKRSSGISKAVREALPEGKRKNTYCPGDETGNNKKPYAWHEFGPGEFFGQEVERWMEIPR